VKHFRERAPGGFRPGPARELLRNRIQISHVAPLVGTHDGVADGVQRDLGPLLFFVQRLAIGRPLDHAAQRFGQPVIVEAILEQKILGAALHGQPRDRFVTRPNQHQNGDLRSRLKQPVEGLDSPAVGQVEIHQHRGDPMRGAPHLFSCQRQPMQTLGAVAHPIDLERSVARAQQGVAYGLRIREIVLYQQYVLRQETLLGSWRDRRVIRTSSISPTMDWMVCALGYIRLARTTRATALGSLSCRGGYWMGQ
jgi:hypothetical protein